MPLFCITSLQHICASFANGSLSVSLRAWPAISSTLFLTQHVASLPLWQAGMPGQARQDTRVKNTPYCSTVTAQRKWTFSLSSPLLPNSQTKQNIKRLRGMFPVEHFAHCFLKCAKKGGFSPFCVIIFYIPFCWAVFHKCSTECHFMFHNDYQPINKNRLRNEIPWNTMFHAPFSDVPRNVPRNSLRN